MNFPPQYSDEIEFFNTVKRLRSIGYGRMMQMISDHWRDSDPTGALSVGPCYEMPKQTCACPLYADSCSCPQP